MDSKITFLVPQRESQQVLRSGTLQSQSWAHAIKHSQQSFPPGPPQLQLNPLGYSCNKTKLVYEL